VARDLGLEEREAARNVRHLYRVDWGEPVLYYDLILNTAALAKAGALRRILQAAPRGDDLPGTPWSGAAERPVAGRLQAVCPPRD
jgi:hypothetical protein